MSALLEARGLRLRFRTHSGFADALRGISLDIGAGERVALVGESGSGKSVTARIVLGLMQEIPNAMVSGELRFEGRDLNRLSPRQWRSLRGTSMATIFQDPTSSLNPVFTIADQFTEVLRRRDAKLPRAEARERAARLLDSVSIRDGERVLDSYAFQLSGGMNQRVAIAMALANRPSLLIADEPGTALDATVQARTLQLMRELVAGSGAATLFISHNLGVVREFADRVYVIYRGRIVERGPTRLLFEAPGHPYTRALMAAVPRITGGGIPEISDRDEAFFAPMVSHAEATS